MLKKASLQKVPPTPPLSSPELGHNPPPPSPPPKHRSSGRQLLGAPLDGWFGLVWEALAPDIGPRMACQPAEQDQGTVKAVGGRLLAVRSAVGARIGVWECFWARVRAAIFGGTPHFQRFPVIWSRNGPGRHFFS